MRDKKLSVDTWVSKLQMDMNLILGELDQITVQSFDMYSATSPLPGGEHRLTESLSL